MMISLFELLKIGVGPSSSHTVGPMLAALQFVTELAQVRAPGQVARIQVDLFGSLALTGVGHRTDRAIIAGLMGEHPQTVDPQAIDDYFEAVLGTRKIRWLAQYEVPFEPRGDLVFHREEFLPQHPNGMRFTAFDHEAMTLLEREMFSVGGGFVADQRQLQSGDDELAQTVRVPWPFCSAEELLGICESRQLSIAQVVHENELSFHSATAIAAQLDQIWAVMNECIEAGCRHTGVLPGGLNIPRRAPDIYRKLSSDSNTDAAGCIVDPLRRMDWVTLFALAVNEENAAGGRVVTAPTNGASGVIPAVLAYYDRFMRPAGGSHADRGNEGVHDFLKTAAAIGMLYKRNASLSAAEMGCQGEVGVACSMAAAGLAAVLGGSPSQIENAAEIGMEHNLGLTCDPVAGLVQVPCIERNAMGAVKAINAARLAVLYGDGRHRVSLDKVIETMRQTGIDMQSKYKETSLGGLALNVVNC
ncbi:MAG: L-serine ammonia-lyase [Pirellulaceae bacterium]